MGLQDSVHCDAIGCSLEMTCMMHVPDNPQGFSIVLSIRFDVIGSYINPLPIWVHAAYILSNSESFCSWKNRLIGIERKRKSLQQYKHSGLSDLVESIDVHGKILRWR